MDRKRNYLLIAAALTALDLFVASRYGVAVWRAYADYLLARLLLLLFVAVWVTTLADLWSRALRFAEEAGCPRRIQLSDVPASSTANTEARDV